MYVCKHDTKSPPTEFIFVNKFSALTIAFLAFWLAKKTRLWAISQSFTLYGKWTSFVFTILLATVARREKKWLQKMTFTH